jgi:putative transposase
MKKSKFSEEQIAYPLREVEGGRPVADVCRQMAVSDATFYSWKKKYGHLGATELRRLRQLEDENNRQKRLVADLTLDKHMLSEALRKNVWSALVLQVTRMTGRAPATMYPAC